MTENPTMTKLLDLCKEARRVDDLSEKKKILERMKLIAEQDNKKKK